MDGSVIIGHKSLREHNRRNNVTNVADFKETWESAAKERERFYTGDSKYDRKDRIEALKHAFDKHRRTR